MTKSGRMTDFSEYISDICHGVTTHYQKMKDRENRNT